MNLITFRDETVWSMKFCYESQQRVSQYNKNKNTAKSYYTSNTSAPIAFGALMVKSWNVWCLYSSKR